jgi:hypothetical protein
MRHGLLVLEVPKSKHSDLQTFTTMADPQVPPPSMTAIKFLGLGLKIGGHQGWRTFLNMMQTSSASRKPLVSSRRHVCKFGMLCGISWTQQYGLERMTNQGISLLRFDSFGHTVKNMKLRDFSASTQLESGGSFM